MEKAFFNTAAVAGVLLIIILALAIWSGHKVGWNYVFSEYISIVISHLPRLCVIMVFVFIISLVEEIVSARRKVSIRPKAD